jgi:hypothetical protein
MNVMEDLRLKRLQQRAILDVIARTSDANNATMATRIGELNSLHVAAYMDIEKTTQSLNNILAYKKELALTMLRCSDEEQMKILGEAINYSDDMIRKVLGMYVP